MTEIRSTEYFAIVPEWVLLADVSANAVRLYALLNRYANSSGRAWPSRRTLAEALRISPSTVDRAKDELVGIKALTVDTRTTPAGDFTSNLYTLATSSPMMKGISTRDDRGIRTSDELNRASSKQSQKGGSSSVRGCGQCLGKHRAGYDDGTEGLAHIWDESVRAYVVCSHCDGSGKQ
jgi:DNA-binding transcriptional MocR family regulator